MDKSKILIIGATHGDEPIGVNVARKLIRQPGMRKRFDLVIGNPRAFRKRRRFIDVDLNRGAPGRINSSKYESRRASALLRLAKRYRFVIDIHSTTARSGIFA